MTIMSRSAAEFWWNEIAGRNIQVPPEVAYYEKKMGADDWEPVTWDEIYRTRTQKMNANIEYKRASPQIKPCLIWVFSHGYWLMGGYYTVIKTIHNEYYLNFRDVNICNRDELQLQVMKAFPYNLKTPESFEMWMREFVKKNRNDKFFKGWKEQGIAKAYCLLDPFSTLTGIALSRRDLITN